MIHDKYSSSVRKESARLCVTLLDCCPQKEHQIKLF